MLKHCLQVSPCFGGRCHLMNFPADLRAVRGGFKGEEGGERSEEK